MDEFDRDTKCINSVVGEDIGDISLLPIYHGITVP